MFLPKPTAAAAVIFMFSFAGPSSGQQLPLQSGGGDAVIRTSSQEVLLDVVVRDKKGRLIRDLKAGDFEIADDGAPQQIRAFRLVSGPEAPPVPLATLPVIRTTGAPATVDPLRQVRIVTLAFDRMGVEARSNTRKAVEDLLAAESGTNLFYAVFSIDHDLTVLQQYTPDRELVRKAVTRITGSASSLYKSESDKIQEELSTLAVQSAANAAAPTNANGAPDPMAAASAALAQMTLNMMQFNQTLDNTVEGRSTLFALTSLIREQYRLPGRKTLLYFSEGLYVPPQYKNDFESLIGSANRANVSVYGIDARGLNSASQNEQASAQMAQATNSSRSMLTSRSGAVTRDQAVAADKSEEAIRANVQNSLADISEKTGGFLIANSNDLSGQLHRVAEDIDTHYELSYSPVIDKFDGHFRKVSVKLARADATVQTRSGYFAVPLVNGRAVSNSEMSMLNALSVSPAPKDISFRSAAPRFQTANGASESAVVMDVPLQGIEFARDEAGKVYRVNFSVMALYKDAQGVIVKRMTQDVSRQGPLDKLDAFKEGHFIYTQHTELAPGRYTLETAVIDNQTGKAGTRKAVVIVPATPRGVAISSLVFVRSFAQAAAGQNSPNLSGDPFEYAEGKVTPGLDDTLKGVPGAALAIYFTVYPQKGSTTTPELSIEFLQDGKLVARAEPKLPAAGSDGRIPYIASSAIGSLPAGQYEVLATVKQDGATAAERTFFTVE